MMTVIREAYVSLFVIGVCLGLTVTPPLLSTPVFFFSDYKDNVPHHAYRVHLLGLSQ